MEALLDWLESNRLRYEVDEDLGTITVGGKTCIYMKPDRNSVLFDGDMNLIGLKSVDDCDYVIFEFGGEYYYSPKGSKDTQFNVLKYVGEYDSDLDAGYPYSFLGVHGGYEMMSGTGEYSDWVKKAKFYKCKALGICEENTLAGAVVFQDECESQGIKPIIGETITVKGSKVTMSPKIYAINDGGWKNMLTISNIINVDNSPAKYIDEDVLLKHGDGLAFVFPSGVSDLSFSKIKLYTASFDKVYYQIDLVDWKSDGRYQEYMTNIKEYLDNFIEVVEPIMINDAYYLDPDYAKIRKKLCDIGGVFKPEGSNQHFRCIDEIIEELSACFDSDDDFYDLVERMLHNLDDLVELISFKIDFKIFKMPVFDSSEYGKSSEELIWNLIDKGVAERLGDVSDEDWPKYEERIGNEMSVIMDGGFVDYFLILWDIVNWANSQNIFTGIGRGSAGGSLISYLLGITHMNPIEYNLLFERFLNAGRIGKALPDIDLDFEGYRRDEVKRYIESKYGLDRVCSVGTYSKLRIKKAMQELRNPSISYKTIVYNTALIKNRDGAWKEIFVSAQERTALKKFVKDNVDLVNEVRVVLGQPRNTSVSAASTIIVPSHDANGNEMSIYQWIPVKKHDDGVLVSEWEGMYLEKAGFLKEDILGIRELDKIRYIVELIKKTTGETVDIYTIPLDDKKTYDLFKDGFNEDVFHFGSQGLTAMSKEMLPNDINDLVNLIALHRPGAMEVGSHIRFIQVRFGEKDPEYDYGLREITEPTNGILLMQEQVMEATRVLGGFNLTEADDIRKAMGKKKIEVIKPYREKFIKHAVEEKGCPQKEAEKIWEKLEVFSGYGFNKCLSGDEYIKRDGANITGKSTYSPNIREMYKVKNDSEYAKSIGKQHLHKRYNRNGYGTGYSLINGLLIRNKIVDIRYEGIKPVKKITLENGCTWVGTGNHKFPTRRGEHAVDHLKVGDELFIDLGYHNDYSYGDFGGIDNLPKKGEQGFQETPYDSAYKEYIRRRDNKPGVCKNGCRTSVTEIHHKDGNLKNGDPNNFEELCVSCHRKAHYKMGRTKAGRKGLIVGYSKIVSIEDSGEIDVYDIEMEAPNHTFVTGEGVVTCNSHAAAYAITGYISQWFKANYPAEFWTTAFEFASADEIPRYITEMETISDIRLVEPDINESIEKFNTDFEANKMYWSLAKIKNVASVACETIIGSRNESGRYFDFLEFFKRVPRKQVNKKVVDNLIFSGCFDSIEEVERPKDRLKIFKKYMAVANLDISQYPWMQGDNEALLGYDFWWDIKQKEMSGYGTVDYRGIADAYEYHKGKKAKYIDVQFISEAEHVGKNVFIGGVITQVDIHKGKNGEFANVLIESNNHYVWMTVWSDQWLSELGTELSVSKGMTILINGNVTYDSWKQRNVLVIGADWDLLIVE